VYRAEKYMAFWMQQFPFTASLYPAERATIALSYPKSALERPKSALSTTAGVLAMRSFE